MPEACRVNAFSKEKRRERRARHALIFSNALSVAALCIRAIHHKYILTRASGAAKETKELLAVMSSYRNAAGSLTPKVGGFCSWAAARSPEYQMLTYILAEKRETSSDTASERLILFLFPAKALAIVQSHAAGER